MQTDTPMVCYIITQGERLGNRVTPISCSGYDTVRDVLSRVPGLTQASTHKVWIVRSGQNHQGHVQLLPVDRAAISRAGTSGTNYRILPGDRVLIAEDSFGPQR